MLGGDFYERVEASKELEWLGVREDEASRGGEALVRHGSSGRDYALPSETINDHSWDELEAVLSGGRDALIMTHLTRIVGYFSRVENWNRSKLAELRDRHKGDYVPPAVRDARRVLSVQAARRSSREPERELALA